MKALPRNQKHTSTNMTLGTGSGNAGIVGLRSVKSASPFGRSFLMLSQAEWLVIWTFELRHGPIFICPIDLVTLKRYAHAQKNNTDLVWRQAQEHQYTLWVLEQHILSYQDTRKSTSMGVHMSVGRQVAHLPQAHASKSQIWILEHTTPCPHCGTYIQKLDGCNSVCVFII